MRWWVLPQVSVDPLQPAELPVAGAVVGRDARGWPARGIERLPGRLIWNDCALSLLIHVMLCV